ncbi:hypothetical protein BC828DRAFT_403925 [Blastocladiella britannica]|nr:hypothetical protein BC828DRAFT_403925 [Blastocladiella britannica]
MIAISATCASDRTLDAVLTALVVASEDPTASDDENEDTHGDGGPEIVALTRQGPEAAPLAVTLVCPHGAVLDGDLVACATARHIEVHVSATAATNNGRHIDDNDVTDWEYAGTVSGQAVDELPGGSSGALTFFVAAADGHARVRLTFVGLLEPPVLRLHLLHATGRQCPDIPAAIDTTMTTADPMDALAALLLSSTMNAGRQPPKPAETEPPAISAEDGQAGILSAIAAMEARINNKLDAVLERVVAVDRRLGVLEQRMGATGFPSST